MDTILIKNGAIVNHNETYVSDILIHNDKIIEIGNSININSKHKTIDAKGKYIFPGGIDPHVHMELQTPFGKSSDNFMTGSLAAIAGGTTTIIDFVTPEKEQSLIKALKSRREEAAKSKCDYLLHMSIVDWHKGIEDEIIQCIENEGVKSFKVYMAYQNSVGIDNETLEKTLHFLSDKNVIVLVHCEIGEIIEKLKKEFLLERKNSAKYHPLSRPSVAEYEAVKKIIQLSEKTNCPVYIVHTSTEMAINEIRKAQKDGIEVYSETCPHYLVLDDSAYEHENEKAINFIMSPPLRKKTDQDALWEAISDGVIQTIGTDHCPFNTIQKKYGLNDFTEVPNGAGGVEHRLEILFNKGVNTGKISLEKFVEITSYNPAKIFGLSTRKGVIEEGYDADIVIWDTNKTKIISSETHKQNCDFNIYEGIHVKGGVELVIYNGNIVKI